MKTIHVRDLFERYRPIVDDFELFLDAARAPLPLTVWRNGTRSDPDTFDRWFANSSTSLAAFDWLQDGFRVQQSDSFEYFCGYLAGLFHIQEEAAMIPVALLDIKTGQTVLDLCAAPGNKAAMAASALGNSGFVVANDISRRRLGIVQGTIDRLGLVNIGLTGRSAENFPDDGKRFDRVLADVPCSCEGTSRRYKGRSPFTAPAERIRLATLQAKILERAVTLCAPGGRIIYATCTFAPEENEAVVAHVLHNTVAGSTVRIVPTSIPGLITSPGLTEWDGIQFGAELSLAIRLWPHSNDTGGFFVVVLEKEGVTPSHDSAGTGSGPARCTGDEPRLETDRETILNRVLEPFGVPRSVRESFRVVRFSRKYSNVVSSEYPSPKHLPLLSAGVRAINTKGTRPHLSTAGALLFGNHTTHNRIMFDEAEFKKYLSRIPVESNLLDRCDSNRVLVAYRDRVFGSALSSNGTQVVSLYPRIFAGIDIASKLQS